mmetsp:Transcript_142765/g.263303  ORF Transcript_142765/g.263303 Transcript_142765/m.263303 type:complete len:151 (+) Transcript_142765:1-453(+)
MVGEIFFSPQYTGPDHSYFGPNTPQPRKGLHQLVIAAVLACPPELHSALLSSIALAGGAGGMTGMVTRLQRELDRPGCLPSTLRGCSPHVLPFEQTEPAWYGGSLAASSLPCLAPSAEEEPDEIPASCCLQELRPSWCMDLLGREDDPCE